MDKRNIYLIGPRGCGKTSVGKALATRLGREFADTDHLLVQTVGMEIADYVDANGWEPFRDRETETLEQVSAFDNMVVGCGGGIVLRARNCSMLATGFTFYLRTPVEELVRRLTLDPLEAQRPTLTGKPLAEEVREILDQREHLYLGAATAVLDADELERMVDAACAALGDPC